MSSYIVITDGDAITYITNTTAEVSVACAALRVAGLASASIYTGVPDGTGDSYRTGGVLLASSDELPVMEGGGVSAG